MNRNRIIEKLIPVLVLVGSFIIAGRTVSAADTRENDPERFSKVKDWTMTVHFVVEDKWERTAGKSKMILTLFEAYDGRAHLTRAIKVKDADLNEACIEAPDEWRWCGKSTARGSYRYFCTCTEGPSRETTEGAGPVAEAGADFVIYPLQKTYTWSCYTPYLNTSTKFS